MKRFTAIALIIVVLFTSFTAPPDVQADEKEADPMVVYTYGSQVPNWYKIAYKVINEEFIMGTYDTPFAAFSMGRNCTVRAYDTQLDPGISKVIIVGQEEGGTILYPTLVSNETNPVISPSGERLAYFQSEADNYLLHIAPIGKQPYGTYYFEGKEILSVQWTIDEGRLLLVEKEATGTSLVLLGSNGKDFVRLYSEAEMISAHMGDLKRGVVATARGDLKVFTFGDTVSNDEPKSGIRLIPLATPEESHIKYRQPFMFGDRVYFIRYNEQTGQSQVVSTAFADGTFLREETPKDVSVIDYAICDRY